MKYFIKTFGCKMNHSDSERIAGFLENYHLKKVSCVKLADFLIFNTCGVRQMAEDRVYGQIHNSKENNPKGKIILTGCLANRKDVQKRLKNKVDLFFPINDFEKLDSWLTKKIPSKTKLNLKEKKNYFQIKPTLNSSYSASVPIMTGCNNFCAYCIVPYARGREISRPADEILSEIKNLLENGYTEIFLLGQNVNSYQDKNINFSKLLKKINALPGNFWINFLSNHPKDITDEFIKTVTSLPKVCELIHFPLQAGDNEILEKMNRKYTAQEYLEKLEKIRKSFEKNKPSSPYAITSDIIVGFPGETKKQFLESAKTMKKAEYDLVFFGQYSPRPGTTAAQLKDTVSKTEKVRRENYLNEILKKTAFQNNQSYLGKTLEIIVDKEKNGYYFGRTRSGKNVKLVCDKKNLIGKLIKVKITQANIWNLEACPVKK